MSRRFHRVFRAAFVSSLPVLMGYLTMGMAAGILLAAAINRSDIAFWGALTSFTSISGALQFAAVDWIKNSVPLLEVAILTLCLNIRYGMYGLSLIERFRGLKWYWRWYLIWTLTDETYALEVENRAPCPEDSFLYCLLVAVLDHSYWVIGVTAGTLIGAKLPFNTAGIDFAMTALFIVILLDQCRDSANRRPALVGGICAIVSRCIFPLEQMLIPAMAAVMVCFVIMRKMSAGSSKG